MSLCPSSKFMFFMVLFIEMVFAPVELLCSAQHGCLSTSTALQVDHRPATCNLADPGPVYGVLAARAVS